MINAARLVRVPLTRAICKKIPECVVNAIFLRQKAQK
jgi:hypothetical protein